MEWVVIVSASGIMHGWTSKWDQKYWLSFLLPTFVGIANGGVRRF